jgi:adenylyltransferase/sulfurtransferase
MSLSPTELARYSRHLTLSELGPAGQEKLKAARVLVIGAGGLGSPALLYLAAAGVGTLGIVDFDKVDLSNLQRQVLFDTTSVAQSKAAAAKTRLLALNPHLDIHVHEVELRAANVMNLVAQYDVVLDGTDRFATRYLVNDACVILGKPLVSAAIHRFEGQAFTYVPGKGPCYRCLFPVPPADGAVPNCAEAGVLGVLPGVMGAIQATEAIKLVTSIGIPLVGRLLTYDALDMRFGEFKFGARPDCAVCGAQASIIAPVDDAAVCATANTDYQSITANSLQALLRTQPELLLVDVREPEEFEAGHLMGAINIPLGKLTMGELTQRVPQLSQASALVFMCRGGGRSAKACALACAQTDVLSQAQIINLEGGLLAWHRLVDQSLLVI